MARGRIATWIAGAAALGLVACAGAAPAEAYWWHGGGWGGGWGWRGGIGLGFGFAPPAYYPPPYYPPAYYPPPVVYAQPPTYYYSQPAPSGDATSQAPAQPGASCYAGAYVCPLDGAVPSGSTCTCPGNTGRVYGHSG